MGRGVEFEGGNGKVNISDKGGETAVFNKKEAEEVSRSCLIKYSINFGALAPFFCLRKKDKMLRISKLLLILSIVLGSVSSFAIDYVQQELLLEESYVAEETLLLESEKLKSALEKSTKIH